jgi:hypothetical protein
MLMSMMQKCGGLMSMMMKSGGRCHLAQILLLAGNFEMLHKYPEIWETFSKRARTREGPLKAFMADPTNFWPKRKLAELRQIDPEGNFLSATLSKISDSDDMHLDDTSDSREERL